MNRKEMTIKIKKLVALKAKIKTLQAEHDEIANDIKDNAKEQERQIFETGKYVLSVSHKICRKIDFKVLEKTLKKSGQSKLLPTFINVSITKVENEFGNDFVNKIAKHKVNKYAVLNIEKKIKG